MMTDPMPGTSRAAGALRAGVRCLGHYELLRLLGKSQRTMAWLVGDAASGRSRVLVLPRTQPEGGDGVESWASKVRKAARLDHPNLAPAVEIGVQDGWPFVAYDVADASTLADRIGNTGVAAVEAATWLSQALRGLAFAHDAGVAHRDLQPYSVLVSDKGVARVIGTEVADGPDAQSAGMSPGRAHAVSTLRAQRDAAEVDVLHAGLLLHHALAGQPALGEADVAKAAQRLPPVGREIVRLTWSLPRPVPEPLRAIVNRASDRQERQRYRSARTLLRALEGWLQVDAAAQGGPIVLLLDRLHSVGLLPSSPGSAQRAARLALMERERTNELAEVVLRDTALAFEMLRMVNTAQLRGGQVSGNGPVLTVRRAIAMVGLDGVRRAALGLRPWPGPLAEPHAAELQRVIERARRAARVAVAIRPAGYDEEVVHLVALMQNLGRLVAHYHFPDEALQIRRLMQPASSDTGEGDEPGMTEEGAAMAVLGVDLEALGVAVGRWWGLDDGVLHMMRRVPLHTPVRSLEGDDQIIRGTASCANEVIDALALPAARIAHAVHEVVNRYARTLGLSFKDVQAALQGESRPATARAEVPADAPADAPAADAPPPAPVPARALRPERGTSP